MKTLKYGKLIAIAFIFLSSTPCRVLANDAELFSEAASQQVGATQEYFLQIICADPECRLECKSGKVDLNTCFKTNNNESQKVISCSDDNVVNIRYPFSDSCTGLTVTDNLPTGKCISMGPGKDAFVKYRCE